MPRIIAQTIANAISESDSEQEIRHAIVEGVQAAESAGYEPGSENLFGEVCEFLRELADRESDQQRRDRLQRAVEIVCEVAEDPHVD